MLSSPMTLFFNFYGLRVRVEGPEGLLRQHLMRDFSYFLVPHSGPASLVLKLYQQPPNYDNLPNLAAAFSTPRNLVYRQGDLRILDYFGQGLTVGNRKDGSFSLYSSDPDLLREMAYLLLLSKAGQHCDGQGQHRLHALAVSYQGRAVLVLLPSGGGKTTMALSLLRRPGFGLVSEDSPLVDRQGRILPFHTCLGVKHGSSSPPVPDQFLRRVRRMEFDPKTLIDLDYFADRLERQPLQPGYLLVGQRHLGHEAAIVPLARRRAWHALVTNMVIGIGLYQGLEFLLERGSWEVFARLGLLRSRLYNAWQLLRRTESWQFQLGRDRDRNCDQLIGFLNR
ncbi:MAG: hypothetical protein U0931_38705 [Vulcanimicrobiota bacterium]